MGCWDGGWRRGGGDVMVSNFFIGFPLLSFLSSIRPLFGKW